MFRLTLAAAIFCLSLLSASAQQPAPAVPAVSTIYYAQEPLALDLFEENRAVTRRMVDRLVMAVTEQPDIARAWRSLVTPADRVGIKVAAVGGRYFSSHRGIVDAIVAGLEQAGVSRDRVVVWDRDAADLRAAGFAEKRGGYALASVPPGTGYDRDAKFVAPVLGRLIWGDALFQEKQSPFGRRLNQADQLSSTSYFARVLSQGVTKIINVPVLSDEAGCGVAGAFYNLTIPNVDNWRRFTQTDGGGADSIPDLYADDHIRPKVVLHIMDALLAQYAGGPRFNPNYAFAFHTIYASKDPVALDATALRLIEAWRKEARLPPVGKRAEWLEIAAQMELGNFAENRISLRPVSPQ